MSTPAGWYPQPDDHSTLRWWDGQQWTAHTQPAMAPPQAQPTQTQPVPRPPKKPRRPWSLGKKLTVWIGLAVIAAMVTGMVVTGIQNVSEANAARAAEAAAAQEEKAKKDAFQVKLEKLRAKEKREKEERERRSAASAVEADKKFEREMNDAGWWSVSANDVYYYINEGAQCSGSYQCVVVAVTSLRPNGCPRGSYISARFLAGDVVVGDDNHITPVIRKDEQTVFELTDISNAGDTVEVTELHCLGD